MACKRKGKGRKKWKSRRKKLEPRSSRPAWAARRRENARRLASACGRV